MNDVLPPPTPPSSVKLILPPRPKPILKDIPKDIPIPIPIIPSIILNRKIHAPSP